MSHDKRKAQSVN